METTVDIYIMLKRPLTITTFIAFTVSAMVLSWWIGKGYILPQAMLALMWMFCVIDVSIIFQSAKDQFEWKK